jgi:hypothetical protein
MNTIVFLGLSLLLLAGLPSIGLAQSCDRTAIPNQSNTTAYRFRPKDDRCEGTRSNQVGGRGLSLAGFYIGQLEPKATTNDLSLRVPRIQGKPQPKIFLNAHKGNYQLEPQRLRAGSEFYDFQWGKGVLERSQVPIPRLRARAYLEQAQRIYLPVILGPSRQYTIVIYASTLTPLKRFEIRQKERVIKQFPTGTVDREETVSWDGQAPAGEYQLVVEPKDPGLGQINLTFRHNPRWLR